MHQSQPDALDIAAGVLEDLGHIEAATPSLMGVKPFMRYMGGKQRSSKQILSHIASKTVKPWLNYCEPFVGAGAVFWQAVAQDFITEDTSIWLNDASADCIGMWQAVKKYGADLLTLVKPYANEFEKDPAVYYEWRHKFNAGVDRSVGITTALRWSCANGIWRVNGKGELNSPKCDALKLPMQAAKRLAVCQQVLNWGNNLHLTEGSFTDISLPAQSRHGYSVLYLDPPYVDSEDKYVKGGFPWESTEKLVKFASQQAFNGWTVGLSNHDRLIYRELLNKELPDRADYIMRVGRSVSFTADKREPVKEIFSLI